LLDVVVGGTEHSCRVVGGWRAVVVVVVDVTCGGCVDDVGFSALT